MLCYLDAYLDRVNVGFAKLQMPNDPRFSETVYGFGAGIFFLGYFLFEVPSNPMLHKMGARNWLARIMLTWAVTSHASSSSRRPLRSTSAFSARGRRGRVRTGRDPLSDVLVSFGTVRQGALHLLHGDTVCDTRVGCGVPFLDAREKNHSIRVDPHERQLALAALDEGRQA